MWGLVTIASLVLPLVMSSMRQLLCCSMPLPPRSPSRRNRRPLALPILLDSQDAEAIHIAARSFAEDVFRVVGVRPEIYHDTLPHGSSGAIVAATVSSTLMKGLQKGSIGAQVVMTSGSSELEGQWESYEMKVHSGVMGTKDALVITGSDRVRN